MKLKYTTEVLASTHIYAHLNLQQMFNAQKQTTSFLWDYIFLYQKLRPGCLKLEMVPSYSFAFLGSFKTRGWLREEIHDLLEKN